MRDHHPGLAGVTVGALLSTYQRTRVEHVCARLGLAVYAYLWKRDQASVLDEMEACGLEGACPPSLPASPLSSFDAARCRFASPSVACGLPPRCVQSAWACD